LRNLLSLHGEAGAQAAVVAATAVCCSVPRMVMTFGIWGTVIARDHAYSLVSLD
jgi:hypothetical protein